MRFFRAIRSANLPAKTPGRRQRELQFESLESRLLLAANIDADGNLTIEGSPGTDIVSVIQFGPDTTVVIANNGVAQGNGIVLASVLGLDVVLFGAVHDLTINTHDGQDVVMAGYSLFSSLTPVSISGDLQIDVGDGAGNAAIVVSTSVGGGLQVLGGMGDDAVLIALTSIQGDLLIRTEGGNDNIQLAVPGAPLLGVVNAEIDTGDGDDSLLFNNLDLPGFPGGFSVESLTVRMGAGNDFVSLRGPVTAGGLLDLDGGAGELDKLETVVTPTAAQTVITGFELS